MRPLLTFRGSNAGCSGAIDNDCEPIDQVRKHEIINPAFHSLNDLQRRNLAGFLFASCGPVRLTETSKKRSRDVGTGFAPLVLVAIPAAPHFNRLKPSFSPPSMHASRLVELAAATVSQHRPLVQQRVGADFWCADQFWLLSRARVNEWARRLKSCQLLRPNDRDFEPKTFWHSTQPVLEEVFLAEVCTRVWCATLSTIDHQRLPGELDPISRSVFVASLEARRRALRLLVFARGLPGISTTSLNYLRRDCENWVDHLLAHLSSTPIALQFCFEKRRVRQMAREFQQLRPSRQFAQTQSARLVTLHYLLATSPFAQPVCTELNAEIATVILSCLPAYSFDGCGVLQTGQAVNELVCSDTFSLNVLEDLFGSAVQPIKSTKSIFDRL